MKKNIRRFLFIILPMIICVFPSIVLSGQLDPKIWEPLGYNSYYNKKIIRKPPDNLLVWTYQTVNDDIIKRRIEGAKNYDFDKAAKYKDYHHEVVLREIDCGKRLIRMKEFIDFDKSGNIIDRYKYSNSEWDGIIPQSRGEALYQKICLPPEKPLKRKK